MRLSGLKLLVTSGPTIEHWDDIRYLTNSSSGKTGNAIASFAFEKGADVTLVSSSENPPPGLRHLRAVSARDMFEAVKKEYGNCNIFISVAAVADFRPVRVTGKIDKRKGIPALKLKKNPDILRWAGENKGTRTVAGFSLQEKTDIEKARLKMKEKNCDLMIVNGKDNLGADKKNFTIITDDNISVYRDRNLTETAAVILEKCLKIK